MLIEAEEKAEGDPQSSEATQSVDTPAPSEDIATLTAAAVTAAIAAESALPPHPARHPYASPQHAPFAPSTACNLPRAARKTKRKSDTEAPQTRSGRAKKS